MSENNDIPVLTLPDGRVLWLEGNAISSEDGLLIAQKLFDAFGGHGPRITRHLMYDVQPASYAECNHTESFEDAIDISKREDEIAVLVEKKDKERFGKL